MKPLPYYFGSMLLIHCASVPTPASQPLVAQGGSVVVSASLSIPDECDPKNPKREGLECKGGKICKQKYAELTLTSVTDGTQVSRQPYFACVSKDQTL